MPRLVTSPLIVRAAGSPPKVIEELVGRPSTGSTALSVARMRSPGGWEEAGQRPEFQEITVVLSGAVQVEHEGGRLVVSAGQALIAYPGEWVRYSTPDPAGAEYIAICLPAFSPELVHRDELSSTERVQRALHAAGLSARVVELPQSTRTAQEAAAAIGCRVEQIAKSLVFRTDSGSPVLVLASGATRVDEARLSAQLGAGVAKADAGFVRSVTGYAIGGVPPLGHPAPLRTLIDRALLGLGTLWAAAGTPHAVFSLTPEQLVAATGGELVAVTRPLA